ncbi:MAG: VOC family protein [Acidimicrobiia bacterium]
MPIRISHTTIDSRDASALSEWWKRVLGYQDVPGDPNDRVMALGATEVADRRNADGTGWVVLADPEGNEFCIVRSDRERSE